MQLIKYYFPHPMLTNKNTPRVWLVYYNICYSEDGFLGIGQGKKCGQRHKRQVGRLQAEELLYSK